MSERCRDAQNNERDVINTTSRVVPLSIREDPLWVLWDSENKTPLAPWQTGHCYRAKWNSDLPDNQRPETTYTKAALYASMGVDELHRQYPFPDDPPETVEPTILLPADPRDLRYRPALMYIDFDDVRNPETGVVTEEVREIVDRLDSYTEISSSGTGLHVLVWADLPKTHGMVNENLHGVGGIEMYDHGRFFGGTWRHVEGTPTSINERQDVVDELVETYDPIEERKNGGNNPARKHNRNSNKTNTGGFGTGGGNSGRSRYYEVSLESFAEPDPIERNTQKEKQGAHPDHGKTTSGDTSLNYNLDTHSGQWHCFAHDSGGGSMEMAAIMAGEMECGDAGKGSLSDLSNKQLLRTCLYARDNLNGFTDDMTPPYRALVAIAHYFDLPLRDPDDDILGATTYRSARTIYDEIGADDID